MPNDGGNIFIILSGMNKEDDKDEKREDHENAKSAIEHKRLMRILESINTSVKDSGDRTSPSPG